jgi:AcrR family transcriptional regulator
MDGFARRKEQSKEEIRKAAWELFSQFGVDRVSIADIARKAGVSQATIYNNFGSKEALVHEFVTQAVAHLIARVQAVLSPSRPYPEKMAAFIDFLIAITTHDRPALAADPVFIASLDLQNDPEIRKIRLEAQRRMTELLIALVREGQAQGLVSPHLSEEALAIYFPLFMDLFTNPDLQRRYLQRPELVRELGNLMLFGLTVQKP